MCVYSQNEGKEIKPSPYIVISFFSILLIDIFSNLSKQGRGADTAKLVKKKKGKKDVMVVVER